MKLSKVFMLSTAVVLPLFLFSTVQACEQGSVYDSEHAVSISTSANNSDTESYSFSVGDCVKLNNQQKMVDVSTHKISGVSGVVIDAANNSKVN